ncbi:MAG: helix-hairpin-helix domain-containing protein [Gammaproteobacteria bacterium]|nr:helix-hairpin-helix domain-containing protein [Gammaproteobacteria bacterium]NVK88454.1 helix-hairpin-helix domain-containing protein [Gammaproteobacteria bacterium]
MKTLLTLSLVKLLCFAVFSVQPNAVFANSKSSMNASSAKAIVVAKVNINSATAEQIANGLTGVGLKKAIAIVKLRKQLGGFKRVEQILDVKGIGPAILNQNKQRLTL